MWRITDPQPAVDRSVCASTPHNPARHMNRKMWSSTSYDGSGLWVCAKRLEKGRFRWPEAAGGETKVVLSHEELALLLGGIDLAATRHRKWHRNVTPNPQIVA